MTTDWFRNPTGSPEDAVGNAAYNALDRHVVRGRADEVAVELGERSWTYADLLAESAAFAGVLRAFGVASGDEVAVAPLPDTHALLVALAGARLGAVCRLVEDPAALASDTPRLAVVATDPGAGTDAVPVVTVDGTGELAWDVVMRAGRTDPAPCADVAGGAPLTLVGGDAWTLADALGATGSPGAAPDGVTAVEVGGVRLWMWGAPGMRLP